MKKSKKFIVAAIVVALALVAGGVVWKTGVAAAYFGRGSKVTVSEKLAQKLSLSEDKVSTALDEIQTERQTERKAEISTKLDKAVADRVITAEQKQKILEKMDEMQQKRKAEREEMKKWQEENKIDWEKLQDYGLGMGGGSKGRFGPMF